MSADFHEAKAAMLAGAEQRLADDLRPDDLDGLREKILLEPVVQAAVTEAHEKAYRAGFDAGLAGFKTALRQRDSALAAVTQARREALLSAADAIQSLHPGEVKASVTFLRERAAGEHDTPAGEPLPPCTCGRIFGHEHRDDCAERMAAQNPVTPMVVGADGRTVKDFGPAWGPPVEPHEFTEDVNDASMCVCGIPGYPHHPVHTPPAQQPAGTDAHEPGCSGRHMADGTRDCITTSSGQTAEHGIDTSALRARAEHHVAEDRRIAGLMRQEPNRDQLLDRAQVTADLLAALDRQGEETARLQQERADDRDLAAWEAVIIALRVAGQSEPATMTAVSHAIQRITDQRDDARGLAAALEAELAAVRALLDAADRSCPCPDATQPWHAPVNVRTDSIRVVLNLATSEEAGDA